MKKIKVLICGKINLSLNVLGKSDGLHLIASVMQSVSFGDYLTAWARADNIVNISFVGEGADLIDKNDNSVKKTVEYLQNIFGDFGADLLIEKGLPLAGGLGGSSADSAAALIALSLLFDFDKRGPDLERAAADLSSDLSFMIKGGCALVTGTGEKILPLTNKLPLFLTIAHAGTGVSSRDAYARFDTLCPSLSACPSDNEKLISLLSLGDADALKCFANALEPASQSLCGGITSVKNALLAAGAAAAVMTGSGGCVAGFFDSRRAADKAEAALKRQGFWAKSCESAKSGIKIV